MLAHFRPAAATVVFVLLFIFFLLFLLLRPLHAQRVSPVNVEMITVEDGLSQSVVYDIAQDKKGFIWIATFNGLDRYDGNEFVHFRHQNDDVFSISSNHITCIFEDLQQRLWIGTNEDGLNYFDKKYRRFYHFLPKQHISNIVEDAAGNFYVCDEKSITHIAFQTPVINANDTLPFSIHTVTTPTPDYIFCNDKKGCRIISDSHKNVYAATQTGLYSLAFNNALQQIRFTKLYGYPFINLPPNFLEDEHTGKYYLIGKSEVLESNNSRFTNPVKVRAGIPYYQNTFIDDSSRLWYTGNECTFTFSLITRHEKLFASQRQHPEHEFGHFTPRLQDGNGTLWMTTASTGIVKYSDDENRFHTLLSGTYIGQLKVVNDTEFTAYDKYLVRLSNKGATVKKMDRSQPVFYQNQGHARDSCGRYWYVKDTNLIGYNPDSRTNVSYPIPWRGYHPVIAKTPSADKKLAKDTMYSAVAGNEPFLDSDDYLWIDCVYGVVYYDIKKNEFHFINQGSSINRMYEDADGIIWMNGDSGIVTCNKKTGITKSYHRIQNKNHTSAAGEQITSFCDDPVYPHQTIWFSTQNGLYRMNKSTGLYQHFTEKNGLPNNLIYAVLADNSSHIWLSTNKGITCVNTIDFSLRNFGVADGLQGSEFNSAAAIKMKDGTLVFGGTNGLNYFNPKNIKPLTPPKATITGLRLYEQPVAYNNPQSPLTEDIAYAKRLNLSYNDNVITFEFAGIDYRKKNGLQYRCRLMPFEKDWRYTGADHEATYTNLDPGDYTFVAEASNTNGIWGKESQALHVHVLPLWWQTWWCKIVVALAALVLLYLIYKYRLHKALEVHRVRNRIASDLHDEIGSTLSAISLFSEMAHEQSKTAVASPQLLKKINETSQKVSHTMRDIVWSISTKNDSFNEMITHMHEHAIGLTEVKGYELHFTGDEKLCNISLSMQKRQNIYLIYKEALNNAIKYAEGSNIWISLRKEKTTVLLIIKDDGIGFDCSKKNGGNGLQNMKNRAASMHGNVLIDSGIGCGCKIMVHVPL